MLIPQYTWYFDIWDTSDGHGDVHGVVGIQLHAKALPDIRVIHSYIGLKQTYMVVYMIMKLPRPYRQACLL